MSAEPLLDIAGLSVHYRRRSSTVRALEGVDLQVGPGETVGLVGESGSGKSTVGRALLGLAPVAAGSVRFAGRDVTHLGGKARRALYRDVQVVFQDPYSSLNPARTIGRTLAEPLRGARRARSRGGTPQGGGDARARPPSRRTRPIDCPSTSPAASASASRSPAR